MVDEADKIFVWDEREPPKKCKACIGLTATVPAPGGRSYIQERLKSLNFKLFSKEDLGYRYNELVIDFKMKDIEAFFDASERSAKLIWCTPEQEEVVA